MYLFWQRGLQNGESFTNTLHNFLCRFGVVKAPDHDLSDPGLLWGQTAQHVLQPIPLAAQLTQCRVKAAGLTQCRVKAVEYRFSCACVCVKYLVFLCKCGCVCARKYAHTLSLSLSQCRTIQSSSTCNMLVCCSAHRNPPNVFRRNKDRRRKPKRGTIPGRERGCLKACLGLSVLHVRTQGMSETEREGTRN